MWPRIDGFRALELGSPGEWRAELDAEAGTGPSGGAAW
jgi:hypothetical protein